MICSSRTALRIALKGVFASWVWASFQFVTRPETTVTEVYRAGLAGKGPLEI